jgi:hypothetical protein
MGNSQVLKIRVSAQSEEAFIVQIHRRGRATRWCSLSARELNQRWAAKIARTATAAGLTEDAEWDRRTFMMGFAGRASRSGR